MKYTDPSEFFKYIIEKADITIINDNQKCLSFALDLLDSEKPNFKLLKLAINNNVYKELLKAYNSDSNAKTYFINKAIKILTDDCFIKDEKAILAVGWLATVIYPSEWKTFSNKTITKEEDKEIIWEQSKTIVDEQGEKENFIRQLHQELVIILKKKENLIKQLHQELIVILKKKDTINSYGNKQYVNNNLTFEDINLEMIYCPAGSFMMGSPINELGRLDDEIPHKVTISKPFYIGKYVVTQKQYQTLMGNNPSLFKGENKPVENVSWNDAKEFINSLSSIFRNFIPIGYKFDLPTEAQWEYACRAGTSTSLNSGKNITSKKSSCCNLDEVGWYYRNSGRKTQEVGKKKPNAWGIYDMHGNVCEWCKDWYGEYDTSLKINPTGSIYGPYHVYRGGSWYNGPLACRSANRSYNNSDTKDSFIGFRVALVSI